MRGDLGSIIVGQNTLIQDLVNVIPKQAKTNTQIGNNVLVGPNSLLEACSLEDSCFIGMGSNVRQGSRVKSFGVVAAGAMLPENTIVPSNQVDKYLFFSQYLQVDGIYIYLHRVFFFKLVT